MLHFFRVNAQTLYLDKQKLSLGAKQWRTIQPKKSGQKMKKETLETKQTDPPRQMNHFANHIVSHRHFSFIFFIFLCVCSSAQTPRQGPQQNSTKTAKLDFQGGYDISTLKQKDDSIVAFKDITYEKGAPSSSNVTIHVYRQRRLIFEGSVAYTKEKWTDSVAKYIKYDGNNRMTNIFCRMTENEECDRTKENDQFEKSPKSETSVRTKNTNYYCPITYTTNTEFIDSLWVTQTQYRKSNSHKYDSVWFHVNGLKRREVNYIDSNREQLYVYSYKYGPEGSLQFKTLQIYRYTDNYSIFNYVRRGRDTINIYSMSRDNKDTTIGSYSRTLLDTNTGKSYFWLFQNGRLLQFSVNSPLPNNSGYSLKLYDGDSTNSEHHIEYIIQKDSPGLSERWVFQPGNNNYSRTDSALTNGLLTVKTYTKKYNLQVGSNVSFPTSQCKLLNCVIYDEKRRLKEIKQYDYNSFKLSSMRRYSYSR